MSHWLTHNLITQAIAATLVVAVLLLPQAHAASSTDERDDRNCEKATCCEIEQPQTKADCCVSEQVPQQDQQDNNVPCDCPCCPVHLSVSVAMIAPATEHVALFYDKPCLILLVDPSRPTSTTLGVDVRPPIA